LVLTGYYVLSHRGDEQPEQAVVPTPRSAERTPGLGIRREEVFGLVVESGARRVRAELRDGQWSIVEPAGKRVPSDLVAALVSAVLEAAEVEVVGTGADRDVEFGLDHPATVLVFERAGGAPLRLSVGGKNPAQTAVYARADGSSATILVGLNAEYYIGLVLQAAAPS
jgi:hypothetical protein